MDKEKFLDLVWRLEEILMKLDHLRNQVGKCGGKCRGFDSIDDEGLCESCCDVFTTILAEEERLKGDEEYNEVMKKLKEACDEDKTGVFQRILNQSREGKVIH